eukprot:6354790-Ditylum_brightwellii.AAC.1
MPRKESRKDLPSLGCSSSSDCETDDGSEILRYDPCTTSSGRKNTVPSKYKSSVVVKQTVDSRDDAQRNIEHLSSVDDDGFVDRIDQCVGLQSQYWPDVKSRWGCIDSDVIYEHDEGAHDIRDTTIVTTPRGIQSYPQKRIARLRRLRQSMTIQSKVEAAES